VSADDIEDVYDLSPLQQGMLLHSLYDGDADTYVAQHAFAIDGPLDGDALAEAWRQTVSAHTALRTSYHWAGLDSPLQVVHSDVRVDVQRQDWSDLGERRRDQRFHRLLEDERTAGFDPAQAPLLRLRLIRMAEDQHHFAWTHHMLPVDGWSVPIIINDVVRRYYHLTTGAPAPPPAAPYRDYIAWLDRQDLTAAQDCWRRALAGWSSASPLGPLRPARPGQGAGPVGERTAEFPPALVAALRAMAARHKVTLNAVLHAAWALVMQRYTGGSEVRFGFASSGRPPELRGVDRMVGTFLNTLPIQIPVPYDGDLGSWLADIQAKLTLTRRYEYSPLSQIRTWAGLPASLSLFDSLLVFQNYPFAVEAGQPAQRLSFRPVIDFEKTSVPLTLFVTPPPASALRLLFHRDRFAPEATDEIMRYLGAILEALTGAERLAAVAAAAQQPDLAGRGASVRYPDAGQTLPGLIERQATATPDAVAVVAEDGSLTYRQLVRRARQTAAALIAAGTRPGQVVGVCAERSLDMVTGLLGALLAGAAYLPLEPSLPATRLAHMIDDAGAGVVLAQRAAAGIAREAGARRVLTLEDFAGEAAGETAAGLSGADAAYVIYTSGSTGRPKGVMISHQAVVNRLLWMQEALPLSPADRVLQKTPLGFDVSVWEVFWPLINGAAAILARPGGHQDADYLARMIERHAVTTAHFVPSMLHLFLDEPGVSRLTSLRRVLCSGEQLPPTLARRFQTLLPQVGLHNLYGPTEAAVDVTWWDCARTAPAGVLPIGDPIANTQGYVLDHRLMPAPRAVPGELYLGGVQLARGYLNRPGLTATSFIAHPLAGPGGRLYRTGDRVRRLPDGSLEFLGRLDHQVKIHGYRIELGEIEQVLAEHPAVQEAAVLVRNRAEATQLAAYVTSSGGAEADPQELREHLRRHLPRHMVPATLTILPAMPLTRNGKLDREALPDPSPAVPADGARAVPATPQEEAVAAVFRDVLGLPEIDPTMSFFDLGGSSFDAVRAIRRIEGATVGLLAAHSSARDLVAALQPAGGHPGILLRMTEPGPASHTLVCVPFGGGSAIAYRPLARALSADTALLAVAMPGHEIGGESGLHPLEDVAQECAEAVLSRCDGQVSVYGHCVGVALAVEIVRRLESAGRKVERLFVGGSLPFYRPGVSGRVLARGLGALAGRRILRVTDLTVGTTTRDSPAADRAEMRYLRSIGGFANDIDPDVLAFVMRAFRHDVTEGSRYFSEHWGPGIHTPALTTPITFIAGTDDPLTLLWDRKAQLWQRFSRSVNVAAVPGGKHYFVQHQPETLAMIIERVLNDGATLLNQEADRVLASSEMRHP